MTGERARGPGKNLYDMRSLLGLTQRQVADAVGVSVQTVSNWETGTHYPKLTPSQTADLCELFNCSVRTLADWLDGREVSQTEKKAVLSDLSLKEVRDETIKFLCLLAMGVKPDAGMISTLAVTLNANEKTIIRICSNLSSRGQSGTSV